MSDGCATCSRAQRDNYLPLRVIKEHLEAIDRGLQPATNSQRGPPVPRAPVEVDGLPGPDDFMPEASELRLSRQELIDAAGLDAEQLAQIEAYGLVSAGPAGHYDGDALVIVKTVAEMNRFGLEPRHLRSFRTTAEREIGLVEQVVSPLVRQRNPEARGPGGRGRPGAGEPVGPPARHARCAPGCARSCGG